MLININDDLIKKLKEQADDKDLSEIVAWAIEFFLHALKLMPQAPKHRKNPLKWQIKALMINFIKV